MQTRVYWNAYSTGTQTRVSVNALSVRVTNRLKNRDGIDQKSGENLIQLWQRQSP